MRTAQESSGRHVEPPLAHRADRKFGSRAGGRSQEDSAERGLDGLGGDAECEGESTTWVGASPDEDLQLLRQVFVELGGVEPDDLDLALLDADPEID